MNTDTDFGGDHVFDHCLSVVEGCKEQSGGGAEM